MRKTILRVWKGDAPYLRLLMLPLLLPLSIGFRAVLAARGFMYERGFLKVTRVPIPIISVGNITLGGTGKTPLVEWLAQRLTEAGFRPGIVLRGYKRERPGTFTVDPETESARSAGDEAYMLARRVPVPVIVGADRAKAIEVGMEEGAIDVALLDDGFQRKNLHKDLDILLLSGATGKESGRLFPLGSLREPIDCVRKADVVVVNKGELEEGTRRLVAGIPVFRMRYRPLHLYNLKRDLAGHFGFIKGRRTLAFSGLGDNESFFGLLESLGADLVDRISFPDHHDYSAEDMLQLASRRGVDIIVTTEKDAVKVKALPYPGNLFYLAIAVEIEGEERLFDIVRSRIGERTW
jgi:tetraacyldisaccharide 4'-kinase